MEQIGWVGPTTILHVTPLITVRVNLTAYGLHKDTSIHPSSTSQIHLRSLRAGWALPSSIVCIAWLRPEPRRHSGGRVRVPTAETTIRKQLASILDLWEMTSVSSNQRDEILRESVKEKKLNFD
ncbi:hypothetical protein KSP39_PZI020153 [Platanthera zijinensis]|uniref:Uncharacterized protein n=1 Tax=Platanthera zijinensis TaxID=2320716 RepID=A0AAP0AZP1_9ASPA